MRQLLFIHYYIAYVRRLIFLQNLQISNGKKDMFTVTEYRPPYVGPPKTNGPRWRSND
jgi:hypothetical protein